MSISDGSPNDTAIVDNNTNLDVSNLVYDEILSLLMFLMRIGLRNGGNGHILFLGIKILHTMTLENIAVKIKFTKFGF